MLTVDWKTWENLPEITRVVFVHVRAVVVLATSKTATTGMLSSLACNIVSPCSIVISEWIHTHLHDRDRPRRGRGACGSIISTVSMRIVF
jgi:hypothetical protein